jgi:hypothetical protein
MNSHYEDGTRDIEVTIAMSIKMFAFQFCNEDVGIKFVRNIDKLVPSPLKRAEIQEDQNS